MQKQTDWKEYRMGSIKGHILINSFLKTEKFMEHYRYLESSARKYGSSLSVIENADILCFFNAWWQFISFILG